MRGAGTLHPTTTTQLGCHQTCRLFWAVWGRSGQFWAIWAILHKGPSKLGPKRPNLPLVHVDEIKQFFLLTLSLSASGSVFVPLRQGTKTMAKFCHVGDHQQDHQRCKHVEQATSCRSPTVPNCPWMQKDAVGPHFTMHTGSTGVVRRRNGRAIRNLLRCPPPSDCELLSYSLGPFPHVISRDKQG